MSLNLFAIQLAASSVVVFTCFIISFVLINSVLKKHAGTSNPLYIVLGLLVFLFGSTHLIEIINYWYGYNFVEVLITILVAIISIVAVIMLVKRLPEMMTMPDEKKLPEINEVLMHKAQHLSMDRNQSMQEPLLSNGSGLSLHSSQKLEAVGRLVAGIAHEINIPVQFVGDHIDFLKSAHNDLQGLLLKYKALFQEYKKKGSVEKLLDDIKALENEIDLPFLQKKCPYAFENAQVGVDRVSKIAQAINEFAHPGQVEKTMADINKAIETTLLVARNEYKYIAHVEVELNSLPLVRCHIGHLNQVFLNLIVNAAHAIEAKGDSGMGLIVIKTLRAEDEVEIRVADSGIGMPDEIQCKIFDPFFTSKIAGKGSGQGLAIARSIVVDKHGGSLSFDSEFGRGTEFIIKLPINDAGLDDYEPK